MRSAGNDDDQEVQVSENPEHFIRSYKQIDGFYLFLDKIDTINGHPEGFALDGDGFSNYPDTEDSYILSGEKFLPPANPGFSILVVEDLRETAI